MTRLDVRLCFFGDSFTVGVGDETRLGWVGRVCARAGRDGHNLTAYNLGVRRETSLQVAERLASEAGRRLRDCDRGGVVLAVGANDVKVENGGQRVETQSTLRALRELVKVTRDAGWMLLVVGPAFVGDPHQNERLQRLSLAMSDECAQLDVPFVDVISSLGSAQAWESLVNAVDGAHPDGAGYEQMAEVIWPSFAEWLRREASA